MARCLILKNVEFIMEGEAQKRRSVNGELKSNNRNVKLTATT